MTDIAARRRKMKFRASHRGLRELDLFHEAFLAAHLDTFDARDLDEYEAVLDTPDQTVLAWILGTEPAPVESRSRVLDLMLSFRYPAPAKSGTEQGG